MARARMQEGLATHGSEQNIEKLRPIDIEIQRGESHESDEAMDAVIQAAINEILEFRAKRINEGKKGIILRIENLAKSVVSKLAQVGIEIDENRVAKVLKISKEGAGEHEYRMQQRAEEIIRLAPNPDELASVPDVRGFCDIPVTNEVKNKLGAFGFHSSNKRAEVLFMDFVEGDDLATALYREVVKRHPRCRHLASVADDLDFEDLQREASNALEFSIAGGKSRDEGERIVEEYRIMQMNIERLVRFLERSGFRLNPAIPNKIERTMDLFHKNGLCLRDAHHRNFMVNGELEAGPNGEERPCKVHAIDFGAAVEFDGPYNDDVYVDTVSNVRYPNDLSIVSQLRKFVHNQEEENSSFWTPHESLKARILKSPGFRDFKTHTLAAYVGGQADLQQVYFKCPAQPSRAVYLLTFVENALNEQPDILDRVHSELDQLITKLPASESNIIRAYRQWESRK